MVLWVIRALFIIMCAAIIIMGGPFTLENPKSLMIVVAGCIAIVILGLAVDLLVQRKSLAALAGIFFGLLAGSLIGLGFNYVINFIFSVYNVTESSGLYPAKDGIMLIINVLCCYLAITFILQTKDDFRFIIPYVEFSKQTKGSTPLLLDTSVIIDGRIADIAATKIMSCPLIVPRFILNELQNIADSADRLRRNRGRRGLDMLNKMQTNKDLDITIEDIDMTSRERSESVDHQLVSAAKKMGGKVVTNDYNLNKVSSLRGVEVININDLANAMKPVVIPGEPMRVKMVKTGDQPGQGIGYMDDGTMIVVEQGRQYLNQEIDLTVTSVLQTSAGRMIFGKVADDWDGDDRSNNKSNRQGRPTNGNQYQNKTSR
jgi:uncharacterized protein YacL